MASTATPVNTASVSGRREVHFDTVDDIVVDAECLLKGGYTRLGNWNLGTMSTHLAKAMQTALDGPSFQANAFVRLFARSLFKNTALKKLKPGFKLPKKAASLAPHVAEDRLGVEELKMTVGRWKREPQRHAHGFLGPLTDDEWNRLTLRHAEMHLSFLLPKS
ncbi:MAG: DUF1569 domain-containing protein [Pirellulales bacterium]|nr:DUF1569 domain-containing protein [Pirellulales bacterium]